MTLKKRRKLRQKQSETDYDDINEAVQTYIEYNLCDIVEYYRDEILDILGIDDGSFKTKEVQELHDRWEND